VSLYNTLYILLLAYLARFLSIQLRPVISGFRQFPREMLEAAEIFGASFRVRIQKIVLPVLLPSLTAGATLVVLLSMNELTVSALLWATGTETLGVAVFSLEQGGESAAASALAVLTVAVTMAVMWAASLLGRRLPSGVLPWRA
jgi:iron(III) transport system permease protein